MIAPAAVLRPCRWFVWRVNRAGRGRFLRLGFGLCRWWSFGDWLAAALAGSAFGADAAGSGSDDFAAAAVGARRVHIHVAQGCFQAVGVGIGGLLDVRLAFAASGVGEYVDELFFGGAL